jgi:hypothetical protein
MTMTKEEALEIVWRCLPLPENAPERLLEAWLIIKAAVLIGDNLKLPEFEKAYTCFCANRGGIEINETIDDILPDFYNYIRQLRVD